MKKTAQPRRYNRAKSLVAQPLFRSRVVRDRTRYSRKKKHRTQDGHRAGL